MVLGPGIGEDAAAIAFGDRCLVVAADPITLATQDIGSSALTINANDVATRGARPAWFLATLLLPEKGTTQTFVQRVFDQIVRAARREGVSVIGGHTEVTAGLDRPIIAGCMLGEVQRKRLVRTSGARPGDEVLLTKGIAIEAASILAKEKRKTLRGRFSAAFLRRCERLDQRISVVPEAMAAVRLGRVHAMHDPTEGGLSTGLYELAEASQSALEINIPSIPILPEARALLEAFGLDPLGSIASGALLVCAPPTGCQQDPEGIVSTRNPGPSNRARRAGARCATAGGRSKEALPQVRQGRGSKIFCSGNREDKESQKLTFILVFKFLETFFQDLSYRPMKTWPSLAGQVFTRPESPFRGSWPNRRTRTQWERPWGY